MFKDVKSRVLAFDIEWVPDPESGKAAYGLPEDMSDREVIESMWKEGGASEEEPMPFLKTVLSRIVSISMVFRESDKDGAVSRLKLHSIPSIPTSGEDCSERRIIEDFFKILDKHHPQLVGYNSSGSDIPILAQRMIKNGLQGGFFTQRPNRPWEGADFFARGSDWNIDLMRCISAWGKGTPSLHEISVVSGIPGKMDGVDGKQVAPMWLDGRLDEIVAYNECDALTTYLLWLRMAHSIGHFDSDQYAEEQRLLRGMIKEESENPQRRHLLGYLSKWESLSGAMEDG
jgi:predicted PolB exonuclease-like 3'-5' exonuclease